MAQQDVSRTLPTCPCPLPGTCAEGAQLRGGSAAHDAGDSHRWACPEALSPRCSSDSGALSHLILPKSSGVDAKLLSFAFCTQGIPSFGRFRNVTPECKPQVSRTPRRSWSCGLSPCEAQRAPSDSFERRRLTGHGCFQHRDLSVAGPFLWAPARGLDRAERQLGPEEADAAPHPPRAGSRSTGCTFHKEPRPGLAHAHPHLSASSKGGSPTTIGNTTLHQDHLYLERACSHLMCST